MAALALIATACSTSMSAAAESARLNAIFSAASQGRFIAKEEEEAISAVGGPRAARYGEITPKGFSTLAARLSLSESDTFADLGSGIGKACSQAVQEFGVRCAVGIELSSTRHATAVEERQGLESSIAERVLLECGDCADEAFWSPPKVAFCSKGLCKQPGGLLADATVLWICSELYSDELMGRIGERICGSNVRAVATLRAFPGGLDGYERQEPPERCEMSWRAALMDPRKPDEELAGSPVIIYERQIA